MQLSYENVGIVCDKSIMTTFLPLTYAKDTFFFQYNNFVIVWLPNLLSRNKCRTTRVIRTYCTYSDVISNGVTKFVSLQ